MIVGTLGAAAASVFPEILHSTLSLQASVTAYTAAASERGLRFSGGLSPLDSPSCMR